MLRPFEEVNVTEAKTDLNSLNMKAPSHINWAEFDTPVKDQVKYERLNFTSSKLS